MLKLNHKNLEVWQKAIEFVSQIYFLTKSFPKEELFGISNQLRRASVSTVSNIAEGASRKSKIERKRFFEIARSSLVEVDSQIEICLKLNYIKKENIIEIELQLNHLFAMLSNLISKT